MKSSSKSTSSSSKRKLRLRDSTRLAKSRGKTLPPNSQDQPLDLSPPQMPTVSTSSDSDDVPLSKRFLLLRRSVASSSGVETPLPFVPSLGSSVPSSSKAVSKEDVLTEEICSEDTLSDDEARILKHYSSESEALLHSAKVLIDIKTRAEDGVGASSGGVSPGIGSDAAVGNPESVPAPCVADVVPATEEVNALPPVFVVTEGAVLDKGVGTPMGVPDTGVPTPSEEFVSFSSEAVAVSEPNVVPSDSSVPSRRKKALAVKRTRPAAEVFITSAATPVATPAEKPVSTVDAPPGARKSKKRPRSSASSSHVAAFSSTFLTKEAHDRLSTITQRTFLSERPIDLDAFSLKTDLIRIFTDLQLTVSVSPFSGFVPSVIHEFFCNLDSAVFDPASPTFERVFVRGQYRPFSATAINSALGITLSEFPALPTDLDQIVNTLTGGVRSRWPLQKDIPSSNLAGQFSLLHKIALFNWMPSSHSTGIKKSLAKLLYCIGTGVRVNLGQLIFDQLKPFASIKVNSSSLIFPNVIFKVLCDSDIAFAREKGKVVNDSVLRPSSKLLKKLSSGPGSTSASVPEIPEEVSAPGVVTPMDTASLRTLHLNINRLERLEPLLLQFKEWVDEVTMIVRGSLGDLHALAAAHAPPPPEL